MFGVLPCLRTVLLQTMSCRVREKQICGVLRKRGMYPCIFYAGEPCSALRALDGGVTSRLDARALLCSFAKQVIHRQQLE